MLVHIVYVVAGHRLIWERTRNAVVTVAAKDTYLFNYAAGSKQLCGFVEGILDPFYTLIECHRPISGQYVQIMLDATTFMNLYEIEVHGV